MLEKIIRELITGAENGEAQQPIGLQGALQLKVVRYPELWMLAAWRVDKPPSKQELVVLIEVVKKIHNPQLVFHGQEPTQNGRVYGYRIYWSGVPMVVSLLRPVRQGRLFEDEGRGNNYQNELRMDNG